jgi:putative endopeptidase
MIILKKAVLYYQKGLDTKRRNEEGIKPVLADLARIDRLKDIADLNAHFKEMVLGDDPLPLRMGVDGNMKDTAHNAFVMLGPSTILPDTTYYKEGNKQGEQLLGLWKNMASNYWPYAPLSKEEQAQYLEDTIAFDKKIAGLVKSQEEWADEAKNYNPMSLKRVFSYLSPLDLKGFLKSVYGKMPKKVIAYDLRFVKGFSSLFNADSFILYKHWAYVKELLGASSYLSEEIRKIGGSYHRALIGLASDPSIEKQAFHAADEAFSEPVGLYYGETYFGPEAKKDVVDMVKSIIAMYKERMAKNDFLQEETKQKAILKLDKIVIKMGYPDAVQPLYDSLSVDPASSFYEATATLTKEKNAYLFSELFKDVDRTRWIMPGDMVNACYNPQSNDITFPAAILQAPFYSLKQSRSVNLGGIGAVIGHEISHAFDNNGAKRDEIGNLHNWWSKEDFKTFKARTKAMIKEFDGIPFAGSKVNGKLVVSENIADNGGMAVTLAIMGTLPDPDYAGYFTNWARIWCQKARVAYQQLLLSVDVHSPTELRANIQVRNFDEWYSTFNVKATDKMYLAPEKRVHIW